MVHVQVFLTVWLQLRLRLRLRLQFGFGLIWGIKCSVRFKRFTVYDRKTRSIDPTNTTGHPQSDLHYCCCLGLIGVYLLHLSDPIRLLPKWLFKSNGIIGDHNLQKKQNNSPNHRWPPWHAIRNHYGNKIWSTQMNYRAALLVVERIVGHKEKLGFKKFISQAPRYVVDKHHLLLKR